MTEALHGKTILITGAASGIGAASAQRMAAAGASIIALDLRAPALGVTQFIQTDMGDAAAIDAAVAQLPPRIDALCNIAGVPGNHAVDLTMRINYLGLRHLTECVLPRMPAGGSIVNLASVAGNAWPERFSAHVSLARRNGFEDGMKWLAANPVPQATVYQYSKEALIVWAMTVASTYHREHGVRINCISPGPVDTALLKDFRLTLGEDKVAKAIDQMGRPGLPADIAPVVAFLCSADSAWIAGENIRVDAGLTAARATG